MADSGRDNETGQGVPPPRPPEISVISSSPNVTVLSNRPEFQEGLIASSDHMPPGAVAFVFRGQTAHLDLNLDRPDRPDRRFALSWGEVQTAAHEQQVKNSIAKAKRLESHLLRPRTSDQENKANETEDELERDPYADLMDGVEAAESADANGAANGHEHGARRRRRPNLPSWVKTARRKEQRRLAQERREEAQAQAAANRSGAGRANLAPPSGSQLRGRSQGQRHGAGKPSYGAKSTGLPDHSLPLKMEVEAEEADDREIKEETMADTADNGVLEERSSSLTCGYCGKKGHALVHCIVPLAKEPLHGCAVCNTKAHDLGRCNLFNAMTLAAKFDLVVTQRANMQPFFISKETPWHKLAYNYLVANGDKKIHLPFSGTLLTRMAQLGDTDHRVMPYRERLDGGYIDRSLLKPETDGKLTALEQLCNKHPYRRPSGVRSKAAVWSTGNTADRQ
ncbi:hypothetical protein B0I35DRAFT_482148 [Stachybotrys elegans]|uniref:Uncharacterized protein n=1 Tax=Stachybotrys elegans TaxID=80388 RepID=A0A8K0SFP1_9HYPO|nr:hypothetical protein B0I35DRAFT_482148 [Stachybotrys elegans]